MVSNIQFGSKIIDFTLEYTGRKSLGVTVTPDLKVLVRAPFTTTLEQVKAKVHKKAPWIISQQRYFLSFQPKAAPRKYVNGETHLYLGRQYRLKVISGNKNVVKLRGKFFEVVTTDKTIVRTLIRSWYLDHAKRKIIELSEPLVENFKKYKVQPSSIQFRYMPTRWGSCTPSGKIILNPDLIMAPKACIEYVIIHELCHLVYHEHSPRFLALQRREMRDWEKWKNTLEKLLA